MTRKIKVTNVEEETRRETMKRGFKHGSIQNGIDKTLDKLGGGVSDKATDLLKKVHGGADVARPAVDAFVKSAMLLGFAEIFNASSALGTKIPGLNKVEEEKYEATAAYLRSYAGERIGTKTGDAAFEVVPMITSALANPQMRELLTLADDDSAEEETQKVKKEEEEGLFLSEDD